MFVARAGASTELGTRYLKSSVAAAICIQNSGRCRYFRKISSKKNDGLQIRYPIVKFQLYLQKLQFKLLNFWYRLQSALAGLNDKQVSKSQFNWLLVCSFQKNKPFKTLVGQTSALETTLRSYPWKLHLKVKFFVAFSTQLLKGNKK